MPNKRDGSISMQEMLAGQVYGIVRETANLLFEDAKGESPFAIEADLLDYLVKTLTLKHEVADFAASEGRKLRAGNITPLDDHRC